MTTNTNERTLLYQTISGVASGAYSIHEGYERVYDQLQKAREELAHKLQDLHTKWDGHADSILMMEIEQMADRYHSELDQDNK